MNNLETRFYKANYGNVPTLVRQRGYSRYEMLIIRDGSYHWIPNVVPMSLMVRTSEHDAMEWLDSILERNRG